MGIAESISAVGMAGTVTGLSYTQATAQQREDEEEAKRAAEAAAENAPRKGADETGPSRGAFPASGSLGGGRTDRRAGAGRAGEEGARAGAGRGPGPGRGNNAAAQQDEKTRRKEGNNDGKGGRKKQAQPSTNRTNTQQPSRKKKQKKEAVNTKPDQLLPVAEANPDPAEAQEASEASAVLTQSSTPSRGKGRRRNVNEVKRQNGSTQDAENADDPDKTSLEAQTKGPRTQSNSQSNSISRVQSTKPRVRSGHSPPNTSQAIGGPPAQSNPSVASTAVENPSIKLESSSAHNGSATDDNTVPNVKSSSNRGQRGRQARSRGGRRAVSNAHIERSRPLVASTQSPSGQPVIT